jgi:hypothetical protein
MMNNKAFRSVRVHRSTRAKIDHDIRAAALGDRIHNHIGGGALPSQLGWGQHKIDKARITLFDPFKGTPK